MGVKLKKSVEFREDKHGIKWSKIARNEFKLQRYSRPPLMFLSLKSK